jgi:hypothetical protein
MKKVLEPPTIIKSLSLFERDLIYKSILDNKAEGIQWLEKLRKFISFHNRNLRRVSKRRFKGQSNDHLLWLREIFINQISQNKDLIIDSSLINAALIVNDACPNDQKYKKKFKNILGDLKQKLLASDPSILKAPSQSNKFLYSFGKWNSNNLKNIPVTIYCPSPYSLFSISVLNILLRLNIPIKSVVILKFSFSRVRSELYRDGIYLFFKRVWRKLVLKSDENRDEAQISLKFLKDSLASGVTDIRTLTRLHNIQCLSVTDFESSLTLDKNPKGDICIFTGGGLINTKILNYFTLGVINIHMGPLPQYKGMDVVEAPILDGCFDSVTLTSHLMKAALDSGPVISEVVFSSDEYKSLGELRNEMHALMPILAIDALISLLSPDFNPSPQISSGQQYYFIHSNLREIIFKVMLKRNQFPRSKNLQLRKEKLKLFEAVLADLKSSIII